MMNNKIKILIAEHDPADLELLHRELKKGEINYISETVQNEQHFINALTDFIPDIILSDYSFPSFNGLTAFKIREKIAPATPFIFVSGTIGEEKSIELIKNGVTDYALKDKLFSLPVKIKRALKESKEKQDKNKTEKELTLSQERLVEAQAVSKVGSWEFDLLNMGLVWSREIYRIFEIDPDSFHTSYTAFLELTHPDDRIKVDTVFTGSFHSHSVNNIEHRIVTPGGDIKIVDERWRIFFNDEGQPLRAVGTCQDITERKKADKQIKDSEQLYRTLFEQNLAGVYQSAINGVIVNCNDALAKMLKYDSGKEMLEINAAALYFSAADRNKFITDITNQEKLNNYESVLKCKDGTPLYVIENISLRKDDVTGEELYDGILIDVTERKAAEQRIINSEEKRRLIMNAALDAIICINTNGDITFWNPNAEAIFGWKENDVVGKRLSGIIIPEQYRSRHDEGIANYLKTGDGPALNVLLELSAIKSSGEEFPIELTVLPIRQGGEEFFCAFIRDITERKKTSDKNRFQAELLETIGQAVMAADTNGIINFWNNAAQEIYGWTSEEAVGQNVLQLIPSQQTKEQAAEIMEKLYQGHSWSGELVMQRKDGTDLTVSLTDSPVYDQSHKLIGIIGVSFDISERKLAEIRVSELNESLQEHVKELAVSNAELEQFAYVASHDLQEPLRMVTSFLTQLEKKYGDVIDEKGKKYIAFAVDGAKRMRQIILDLLEFSRVGRTEDNQEDLDLNALVKEIEILFKKQIEEKKAIIQVSELPVIHAYKTPLRQVFQNLISNALKYTEKNTPSRIQITAEELKTHWQFAITDNGIGIGKEYFDKIFIIFQRLHNKDEFSGTGMGLAISKKIIENQGGRMWVESEEGKGSTFYFTIKK